MSVKVLTDDLNLNGHHLLGWNHLSDIPQAGALVGQALVWNGTQYAPADTTGFDGSYEGDVTITGNLVVTGTVTVSGIVVDIDAWAAEGGHYFGDGNTFGSNNIFLGTGNRLGAQSIIGADSTWNTVVNIWDDPFTPAKIAMRNYFGQNPVIDWDYGLLLTGVWMSVYPHGSPSLQITGGLGVTGAIEAKASSMYFDTADAYTWSTLYFGRDDTPSPRYLRFDKSAGLDGEFVFSHPLQTNVMKTLSSGQIDVEDDIHIDVIAELTTDAGVTIDGMLIKDGGVAAYDAHLIDVSNPHSVTQTQVGLSAVWNGAQLLRANNDFIAFAHRAPATNDVVLFEDAGTAGTKAWCNISQWPVSTAVQSAIDLKQDELTAGTNIDATDLASAIVSVIDDPVFAGTVDADKYTNTDTAFGADKDLYNATHNPTITGVWTTDGLHGFVSDMTPTFASGSFMLGHMRSFVSTITITDSGASFDGGTIQSFKGVIDMGGLAFSTGGADNPFYMKVSNTDTAQDASNGAFRFDFDASNTTSGEQVSMFSTAKAGGSANPIGYKGYAIGASGCTGTVTGVMGYGYDGAGTTLTALIGVQGLIAGTAVTPNDKRMAFRGNSHLLIYDGSGFFCSSTVSTPNALSPTHVDPLNNAGELYVEEDVEIDGELFCDGNISKAVTDVSSSPHTVLTTDTMVDATSGAHTENLPAISGLSGNREVLIKKIDASGNAVTVTANGSDTIDGAGTYALSSQYDYVRLVAGNGTEWHVVG